MLIGVVYTIFLPVFNRNLLVLCTKMSFSKGDYFSQSGRFINDRMQVVDDLILGYLATDPNLGLLNYGKVIVCRNYVNNSKVKVVSGGAFGHEPAHVGFVGKGMLTAAIQGDIFTSPPWSEVFRTIKELSFKNDTGILIIVSNNASDRLNFGLAAERARNQCIEVKMLVVSEDCCGAISEYRGARGLSGIVLLNKIAGAMAETEMVLEEMYSICQQIHLNMRSVLLSLQSCTSPNSETCICARRVDSTEMEIGSGLSGEVGFIKMKQTTVREACELLFQKIISEKFQLGAKDAVVVLINNLGTSMQLEELIFVKEFINKLLQQQVKVERVYHGHFLTGLNMKGFSATVLKVIDPRILEYLDAPCEALSWKKVIVLPVDPNYQEVIPARVSDRRRKSLPGPSISDEMANILLLALQFICDALISCLKQINLFDSESGSGNVGSKVKNCCEAILSEAQMSLDFHHPRLLFESLGNLCEKHLPGTLGFLYSIAFEAASGSFRLLPEEFVVDVHKWIECLNDARRAVKNYGQVDYGSNTMYDPLYSFSSALEEALTNKEDSLMDVFEIGVSAAEKTAASTKEPNQRYPDPGAHVVAIWARALLEAIKMSANFVKKS